MDERSVLGLLGTLVVIAVAVVGVSSFVRTYLLGSVTGAPLGPTVGALAVAAAFVVAMAAWGGKTTRWRENPYW